MSYTIKQLEWERYDYGKYQSWIAATSYHFYTIRKHTDAPEYYVECMFPNQTITIGVETDEHAAKQVVEDHWKTFITRGLEEC